jgi:hypothetical protein
MERDVAVHDHYRMPPRSKYSTNRELTVIAEDYLVACQAEDKRIIAPIRNAVKLIVDLIDERSRIRTFGEPWDEGTEGEG